MGLGSISAAEWDKRHCTKLHISESASIDQAAEIVAKRQYGEAWMSHVDSIKADMRKMGVLQYDALLAKKAIEDIDMRILGLNMTPKPFRAERLERWSAGREEKVKVYNEAKEEFEKLSSKINK